MMYSKDSVWNFVTIENFTFGGHHKSDEVAKFSISPMLVSSSIDEETGERFVELSNESEGVTTHLRYDLELKGNPFIPRSITLGPRIEYNGRWMFLKSPELEFTDLKYRISDDGRRSHHVILDETLMRNRHLKYFCDMVKEVREGCFDLLEDQSYRDSVLSRPPFFRINDRTLIESKDGETRYDISIFSKYRYRSEPSICQITVYPKCYMGKSITFVVWKVTILELKEL